MPISPYLANLRRFVGHELLVAGGVAALVRDADRRLLLQRRHDDGRWGLPGGAIDPGEPPARALVREVFEETGLVVRATRVVAVLGGELERFTYPNGDVVEYTLIVFEAARVRGEIAARDGESLELAWLTPGEVARDASPHLQAVLPYLEGSEVRFQWDEAWLDDIEKVDIE
jgi:8-oxo-dGTP pyrophosphatase MutT (NUDIX family)